jgi:hypothetical protein
MKRIPILIIKWLANKLGYKTAMIKIGGKDYGITVEGDKELLKYVDITGYTFNREPLTRVVPKRSEPEPMQKIKLSIEERMLTLDERMHYWFDNSKPNRYVCDSMDELDPASKSKELDKMGVPTKIRTASIGDTKTETYE